MLEGRTFFLEEDKLESRFLAEKVGGKCCLEERESDGLMILEVCCGSPIRRTSVSEG